MSFGTLQGIWTLLVLITFVGIVAWAWSDRRRDEFERAANMPLDDDDQA